MTSHRALHLPGAAALLALALACTAPARPSVVLITIDTLRADHLGCYGYGRPTTPHIDALAKESLLFERAYTPAVYTLAAMSSVWTSQYPERHHDAASFSEPLPRGRLTLAQLLSAQGIQTAGFVANPIAGGLNGLDRGFTEFHEVWREFGSRGDSFRQVVPGWLKANKDRRFFAYVHFREPHFPYDPPPPFDTKFGPDAPLTKEQRRDTAFFTDVNQGRRSISDAEREHLVRLYDGSLAFADQEVGGIRKVLEAEGLLGRTVIIVAADHGEGLMEHGWIGHNVQLYEINRDLPDLLGITSQPWKGIFGLLVVGAFYLIAGLVIHILITWSKFEKKIFERTTLLQYSVFQFFAITVLVSMPVKLLIRQVFRIKYVMVTPWFNI